MRIGEGMGGNGEWLMVDGEWMRDGRGMGLGWGGEWLMVDG